MNKMQKLQSVNDQIRTLRNDNNVLAELCARIEGYVKEGKFLPADLYDSAIMQLNSMKEAQDVCRKDYTDLVGTDSLPETFSEADKKMEKQHELFCKEEIMQYAVRFRNLVTDNPVEAVALKEAQDKTEIVDPNTLTLEECRVKYQPYIDYLNALTEKNVYTRIGYVRKLEESFVSELVAGAIINQDIHDSGNVEETFEEEDLDDYDLNSEETVAAPSFIEDEDPDDAEANELEDAVPDVVAEQAEEPVETEEIPAAEASAEEAAAEDTPSEEIPAEVTSVEEIEEESVNEAETGVTETSAVETSEEAAVETADEAGNFPVGDAKAQEEEAAVEAAEAAEEIPVIEDYLEDFDRNYVSYYRAAADKEEPLATQHLSSWTKDGETFGLEGVKKILTDIGFHVHDIEEQDKIRDKYENYNVVLEGQDSVLDGNEPTPLVNFKREACLEGFRVVCLYGAFSGEALSRAFREIGNRHHTLIFFQEPMTQGVRRSLVRLVRKEGLRKEFAVIDKVVYAYLERNYKPDRIKKMFLDIVMPGPETK
jgi:hypothetical protein